MKVLYKFVKLQAEYLKHFTKFNEENDTTSNEKASEELLRIFPKEEEMEQTGQ